MKKRKVVCVSISTWSLHTAVMIWIDADLLLLRAERKLAAVQRFELVVGLKIRPAPHSAVDNMRQTFTMGHLEPSVQGPRNGNAFTGLARTAQSLFQLFHGPFFLLELLNEGIHSLFRPLFLLISLFPAQQPFHSWTGEGEEGRDGCSGVHHAMDFSQSLGQICFKSLQPRSFSLFLYSQDTGRYRINPLTVIFLVWQPAV